MPLSLNDSIVSPLCLSELERARDGHKRLVPLVHRTVAHEALPGALAEYQWISCSDADDFDVAVETLRTCLLREVLKKHTRLLERAREWERQGRSHSYLLRGEDFQDALRWLASPSEPGSEHSPTAIQSEYIQESERWERAELQRYRALHENAQARHLAARAASVASKRAGSFGCSLRLAVESLRLRRTIDADRALRAALKRMLPCGGVIDHPAGLELIELAFDRRSRLALRWLGRKRGWKTLSQVWRMRTTSAATWSVAEWLPIVTTTNDCADVARAFPTLTPLTRSSVLISRSPLVKSASRPISTACWRTLPTARTPRSCWI